MAARRAAAPWASAVWTPGYGSGGVRGGASAELRVAFLFACCIRDTFAALPVASATRAQHFLLHPMTRAQHFLLHPLHVHSSGDRSARAAAHLHPFRPCLLAAGCALARARALAWVCCAVRFGPTTRCPSHLPAGSQTSAPASTACRTRRARAAITPSPSRSTRRRSTPAHSHPLSSRRCEPSPGCRRGWGEPGPSADVAG